MVDTSNTGNPTAYGESNKLQNSPSRNDDDEDEMEEPDPAEIKPWDEGGVSDCGYSDGIHDTLMSVGQSVHNIVGPPTETVKAGMGSVGNWFQEASYAVRDIVRGENKEDLHEDASQAFSTIISGGETNQVSPSPSASEPATTKI